MDEKKVEEIDFTKLDAIGREIETHVARTLGSRHTRVEREAEVKKKLEAGAFAADPHLVTLIAQMLYDAGMLGARYAAGYYSHKIRMKELPSITKENRPGKPRN